MILLFTSPDQVVLTQAWNALNSVTKTLDTSDQMAHVADVRQAVRFAGKDGITDFVTCSSDEITNHETTKKWACLLLKSYKLVFLIKRNNCISSCTVS